MRRHLSIALAMLSGIALLLGKSALDPRPRFIWNESVPIGLYAVQPVSQWFVTELVAIRLQAPLATFLAAVGYLPVGVPMLKRILALSGQTVCRRELAIIMDAVQTADVAFAAVVQLMMDCASNDRVFLPFRLLVCENSAAHGASWT
ncbi:hypothetical protein [Bradyrhizobium sp. SZCCHNS3002]|uniref:hypothetical protein n=1 Tax=unclassified Bradyrhizobium TaxID=2631580 RepID=UPI0028E67801|nr:hypothetical protein [Bradyrhizobium sp. SZCCHNS3002]